jgi:lymphocyte antigen 6 complex protein
MYYVLIILCTIHLSDALECYVCHRQEKNHEKCLDTIVTCEQEQDMCLSEIKWGSPPYWSRGNAKQYYVSKRCASRGECDNLIKKSMPTCTYIWYYDWKCTECCAGDRCNYYVTLAGSSIRNSITVTISSMLLVKFIKDWFF